MTTKACDGKLLTQAIKRPTEGNRERQTDIERQVERGRETGREIGREGGRLRQLKDLRKEIERDKLI